MAEALEGIAIRPPAPILIANVTARPVAEPARIRKLLIEQVTGLVRWRESMLFLKEDQVEGVFELGAGRVLAGLAKRIDRALEASSIGTPAQIEAFLKTT
jgi:[acyl-carrier-protein] S-malonyltransferase